MVAVWLPVLCWAQARVDAPVPESAAAPVQAPAAAPLSAPAAEPLQAPAETLLPAPAAAPLSAPAFGSPEPPVPLREGVGVTTAQGAGTAARFVLAAAAGATYLLEVEQLGLDFVVTVEPPSGEPRAYDSPLRRDDRELVLIGRTAPGEHLIVLSSEEHTGAAGRHTVRVQRLDEGLDPKEEAGWAAMSLGAAASRRGGEQGRREAIAAYTAAAGFWRELGRGREQAQAVNSLAALEYDDANWRAAADFASAAAELYANAGQTALSAGADRRRAAALIELATTTDDGAREALEVLFGEALGLLERARAAHERSGDAYAAALAINELGVAHHVMGDIQQAKASWLEATALFHSLDEWDAELTSLSNQAVIDVEEGQLLDAIARFERVIDLLPEGKLLDDRAWTLSNLAATHRLFGNLEQALQMYDAALELHRENGDLWGEAYSLRGIGQAYYGLGELELATDYLEAALPKTREANDGRGEESAVRYLGNVAYRKRDYDAALAHHEAALALATSPLDVAYLQVSIAKDLAALGRHAEAMDLADAARVTAEATETRLLLGDALLALGQARAALGDNERASGELERARSIYAALELGGAEADALNALAAAARARGDLDAALRYGESSLAAVEDLRTRISHPELRAYNMALRRGYFDAQIDLLMTLHRAAGDGTDRYLRAAFDVSERARTRMLVDLLHEASVDLSEGMDPALTRRRDELYDELAERSAERDSRIRQTAAEAEAQGELVAVMGEMRALETELNLVEAELRRANPRYAELSAPQALTSAQVQAMIEPRSVLVQYALGEDRSYAWLLTHDSVRAIELAGRDPIESAARAAFDRLRAFRPSIDARRELDRALADLAALVWAPLADSIDAERVLVASSGALQYVPFGVIPALPSPESPVLLERYEIVVVPSMSGLAAQATRQQRAPPPKTVAVFADPVLEIGDTRFAGAVLTSDLGTLPGEAAGRKAAPVFARPELSRLAWTGREAEAIAALVPEDQRMVATGFGVTRDAVFASGLDAYRYLHFATHGRVDSRNPGLSSLAMSRLDELGMPLTRQELRLHDVYNLRLNADLVTLSACETALGREVRGESLIGLTQGFLYAGAHSVAASLWQVPDRATAELMTRFYRFMFTEGLRPAEALRQAQLSVASERRTSHPYYWGAFILLGDWQ
jgi:CHAT domain-containing protein/tetratricopeptide (TPR) repeat protein